MNTFGGWLLWLLPPEFRTPLASQIIASLLGLVLLWVCIFFARLAVTRYVNDADSRYRMRKIVSAIGVLLGVLYLAGVFSQNLRNITLALGLVGAGVALAMRSLIVGVASWVAITFGGYFRAGDRVSIGGVMGDVIDIGTTRVTLMECGVWVHGDQYNGRIVRVPNATVVNGPVYNYSQDFPFVWDELTIPILQGSDLHRASELVMETAKDQLNEYVEHAKREWQKVVRRYAIEAANVEPMVFMMPREEGWVEFGLRYVVDYKKRRSTKTALYLALVSAIERTNGRVRLAASQLELVAAPNLSVRILESEGSPK